MKFKKAELTTKQIVLLVVLIASFAVILFFILSLNLGDESDKQLCYNSVMNRANNIVPTDSIPLNCKRSYVCVTQDGSCEKMIDPIKKKVKTEDEVYEVLAEELSDCWWMFGEGKVNYAGSETFPGLYCSICSQIAFDDSVKDIFNSNKFDKEEFYKYMVKTKVGGSSPLTYTEYLIGTNDLQALAQPYNGNFGDVSLDDQYYSLIGIASEVSTLGWIGIGALFLPLAFIPGVNVVAAIGIASVVGGGGYFISPMIVGSSGKKFIAPTLIKAGSKEFTDLKCDDITTSS